MHGRVLMGSCEDRVQYTISGGKRGVSGDIEECTYQVGSGLGVKGEYIVI
jgi:hypothetical protein